MRACGRWLRIQRAIPPCSERAWPSLGGRPVSAADGLSNRCRYDLPNRESSQAAKAPHPGYVACLGRGDRSEEHTSELQSLMRISYAVFCLKKKKHIQ